MFRYAEVSLPLHLGYCSASTVCLVLVWRARTHLLAPPVRTQLAVCKVVFVVHVCTVVVYHFACLHQYTRSLERCQDEGDAASWVRYLSGITCLQFAQSASLYNIACLFLLRLRQGTKGVACDWVWCLQVLSIACALCSSVLMVMVLCLVETRVRCVHYGNTGGHATICLNAVLTLLVTLHATVIVDLEPNISCQRVCYNEMQMALIK